MSVGAHKASTHSLTHLRKGQEQVRSFGWRMRIAHAHSLEIAQVYFLVDGWQGVSYVG